MHSASVQNQNSASLMTQEVTKPATLQKLLVAYDFSSASDTALHYAIEIARTFHSEIVLAHIETPETLRDRMDNGVAKAKIEQLAERHDLNLLADQLKSEGINVSYLIRSGSATDLLVQLVAEGKPDLLLLGAYGHHSADRIMLGSTAEYLLRSVRCPVLIVGPSVVASSAPRVRLSKILYASSLPKASGRAQELARELARGFAMHIHIVHVEPYKTFAISSDGLRELEMQEEKIADDFRRHGVGSSWTLQFGSQQDRILEQAKVISADLLCFGVVHPATDPSQMGALSAIVRAAKCPILTVPGEA
jgi:nucleotide-binding universal stress UspA family protein